MNEKEISEIRRRFRPDKSNIANVRGCYVNKEKEIIAEFNQSIHVMQEEEAEKFLSILKRTLSGTIHKNLIDIEFTNQQVVDSEEHKLLMKLRETALKDDECLHEFFEKVIQDLVMDENYLILLAHDTYDVPYRSKDGYKQEDASSDVFTYVLCSICPVKMTKPALSYHASENEFGSAAVDWIVSPPEIGFMFPAFDDRCTNIYNALYYTRSTTENHQEFVSSVFNLEAPMPAEEQKETFQNVLCTTLEEECNFEVVQAVHEQLQGMIEEHKESKEEEPLTISKKGMERILESHQVSESHIEAFSQYFDEQFGPDTRISPKNLIDTKQLEIIMPDVKIKINADREDLVETRIIDGIKYVLIRAEEGVELNGIPVRII